MAREDDPHGHLRQGLQWQDVLDARENAKALQARLKEFDVPGVIKRFRATNPPADAAGKLDAILSKLIEAIGANPGHPGRPQSRWEGEALQELQRFAGEAPVEQSHGPERPTPAALPPIAAPAPLHRERAITASEAGRMGGTEAQKRRQEAGELAWAADALKIAKAARVEDPHISTKTICERIWSKCRFKNCPPPDEEGNPSRQLYRFIAKHEAIEDGIPRRALYNEKKATRRRAR